MHLQLFLMQNISWETTLKAAEASAKPGCWIIKDGEMERLGLEHHLKGGLSRVHLFFLEYRRTHWQDSLTWQVVSSKEESVHLKNNYPFQYE